MAAYNSDRILLAMECAEALKLKPISPIINEYAMRLSDLPRGMRNEASLLTMGVVYRLNGLYQFVDTAGHTCLLPANEIFKEELEQCGYVVCKEGTASPDFEYPMEEVDVSQFMARLDAEKREDEARKKATLPLELAKKVVYQEPVGIVFESHPQYGYDVFNYKYWDNNVLVPQFDVYRQQAVVEALGYENALARKFMSLMGSVGDSLTRVTRNATDLNSFILRASKHPIFDEETYFGPNGIYNQFVESQKNH